MITKQTTYIPGVCNIGPAEQTKRRQVGIICLIILIIVFIVLLLLRRSEYYRILLFIPAFGASIGLLQDKLHFCAGYGLRGLFNVLHNVGDTESVDAQDMRAIDRRKSLRIINLSLGISLVVVLLSLATPR
jgi:hypothetical protein